MSKRGTVFCRSSVVAQISFVKALPTDSAGKPAFFDFELAGVVVKLARHQMRSHTRTCGMLKLDAKGNIRYELPCCKCAYDLRGIRPDGRCPECGTETPLSIAAARPSAMREIIRHDLIVFGCAASCLVLTVIFNRLYEWARTTGSGYRSFYCYASLLLSFAAFGAAMVSLNVLRRTKAISTLFAFILCLTSAVAAFTHLSGDN